MADYGPGGIAGGWEFAAAADREQQAARLRNALVAAQLGQAQRAEAQQNALREQLQRATEGPEVDMNAISRALIAGGDTAVGVNILKMQQQERARQAEQNAMRQLFHVEQQPMPQVSSPMPQQPNLSFLSPRDQTIMQADMARNPTAPAQFSNAPGLARTPPQWGQGMPLNQPAAPPQLQPTQQGGILGPYLSHPNKDIQAMAQQIQQLAAAGLFKDSAALSAAVEKVANAAVQAGNIDRGMAGGALTPAVDAAGRPTFIQMGRGGVGVQQIPGFAPPPNQGREPPIAFTMMSQEEVRQAGLPEGTLAQRDSRGQVHPLPGNIGTGKALPVSAAQKIFENQQNLRRAEQALILLQGKAVGGMQGSKTAIGLKGYMPEAILQRTDPSGIETRAAIADLGSMIIHDRSGAAVTAAEYPRLRPFIPLVTDDAEAAKKKLMRFTGEYRKVVQEAQDFYKESGYKVPDVLQGTDEREPHAAPATDWKVIR